MYNCDNECKSSHAHTHIGSTEVVCECQRNERVCVCVCVSSRGGKEKGTQAEKGENYIIYI